MNDGKCLNRNCPGFHYLIPKNGRLERHCTHCDHLDILPDRRKKQVPIDFEDRRKP